MHGQEGQRMRNKEKLFNLTITGTFAFSAFAFSLFTARSVYFLYQFSGALIAFFGFLMLFYRLRLVDRLAEFSVPEAIVSSLLTYFSLNLMVEYAVWTWWKAFLLECAAVPFLFALYYLIFRYLKKRSFFRLCSRTEFFVFGILSFAVLVLLSLLYQKTYVFFMGKKSYDILYTTDSGAIYFENSFLNFTSAENDIRQPYYAMISLPFAVLAKGVALLFPGYVHAYAIGLQFVQWLVVVAEGYMLLSVCKIRSGFARYAFMAMWLFSYCQFFFVLLIEQYVFGVFYLLLTVFLVVKGEGAALPVCALSAGGLLTSLALAPFVVFRRKCTVEKVLKRGVGGLCYVLLFLAVSGQFSQLSPDFLEYCFSQYGGFVKNSVIENLQQYTHFVANLFLPSESDCVFEGLYRYILLPVTSFRFEGIVLFLLAAISFFCVRKNRLAQIAAYWIAFSFVLFVFAGYGTAENGLILYSHYFGWAFLLLYALAIQKLCARWKKRGEVVCGSVISIFAAGALVCSVYSLSRILLTVAHYYPGPLMN